jgi:hypothetical protein
VDVYFAENQPPIRCESVAELDAALDRLHWACEPSQPILVCIDLPQHRLDIGLGADPTFVIVNTQSCDGEYWITVADDAVAGVQIRGSVDFFGCGNHQEMARRNLIPAGVARQVIRNFVVSGQRSASVFWEDWSGELA